MSTNPQTPVKKRGRKLQDKSANDLCRICKSNLRVEFGSARCSSENLFARSERKDSAGLILANALRGIGLVFQQSTNYSDRTCRPCGRKIRNAVENYTFLKTSLQNEQSIDREHDVGTCRDIKVPASNDRHSRESSTEKDKGSSSWNPISCIDHR